MLQNSKPKVVIVDYQLGNLFSVKQACEYLGYQAVISNIPDDLIKADFAILPGVGAFADAMNNLKSFGLDDAIGQYVDSGKPLMGVCLGMQLLFNQSTEFGNTCGLGIIKGKIEKFETQNHDGYKYKVPQIQWNKIAEPLRHQWNNTPFQNCQSGDYMYFVHSFYAIPSNEEYILSKTSYGEKIYCSSIIRENIFATQFHPEKSGLNGINIYKNWFNINSK